MKNVINLILKILKKIWEFNLCIILFLLYILMFSVYKFFLLFKTPKENLWWIKSEEYNIKNRFLPF